MKPIITMAAALMLGASLASPASATLQIAATVNGVDFFCADGQACDTSAGTPGLLTTGTVTIGGVQFNGSEQIQTIGPPVNDLTTSSFSIINNTGSTASVRFAVGGTGFAGPVSTYSASGSGTWLNAAGSNITMAFYADAANTQGADNSLDLPGTLLVTSPLITAGVGTDAYSFTHPGGFTDPDLFSWTMAAAGEIINGGTLLGRSQDITASVVVDEPWSLAILGIGLIGLAGVARCRRRDGGPAIAA